MKQARGRQRPRRPRSTSRGNIELIASRDYRPGDCVDWEPGEGVPGRKPTTTVPCAVPHQFEVTGDSVVRDHDSPYPTEEEEWNGIDTHMGATDCRHPHQLEVVGRVELPTDGVVPGEEDRDGWSTLLRPHCASQATNFLGSPQGRDQAWRWYPGLRPESVAAGTRTVFCVVGTIGDGDWATLTGSRREATT